MPWPWAAAVPWRQGQKGPTQRHQEQNNGYRHWEEDIAEKSKTGVTAP